MLASCLNEEGLSSRTATETATYDLSNIFSCFSALLNEAVLLILIVGFASINAVNAQCTEDESTIQIVIVADAYPNETSWELLLENEMIASGGAIGDTICIDGSIENACLQFSIYDSFGDGIFEPGGYWVFQDGVEMASGEMQ